MTSVDMEGDYDREVEDGGGQAPQRIVILWDLLKVSDAVRSAARFTHNDFKLSGRQSLLAIQFLER